MLIFFVYKSGRNNRLAIDPTISQKANYGHKKTTYCQKTQVLVSRMVPLASLRTTSDSEFASNHCRKPKQHRKKTHSISKRLQHESYQRTKTKDGAQRAFGGAATRATRVNVSNCQTRGARQSRAPAHPPTRRQLAYSRNASSANFARSISTLQRIVRQTNAAKNRIQTKSLSVVITCAFVMNRFHIRVAEF